MVLGAPPAATWLLHRSTFHRCAKDSSSEEDWWCRRPRGWVDEQIRGFFVCVYFFLFFPVDGGLLSVWLGLELSARRPSCSGAVTGIIEQLLRDTLPLVFACYGKMRVPEWAPVAANPAFSETDGHLFYLFFLNLIFSLSFPLCARITGSAAAQQESTVQLNNKSQQMIVTDVFFLKIALLIYLFYFFNSTLNSTLSGSYVPDWITLK